MLKSLQLPLRTVLLASVIGLSFAGAASAQDYDRYGAPPPAYGNGAPDEIVIYAPRHHYTDRSAIGAPIEDVSLSQAVRYDDLDLRSDWGIHKLHERISETARALCHRLDVTHPIAVSDSPPCYRTAMEEASRLAIAAIDRANAGSDVRRYNGYQYGNGEDDDLNR
jgi:UrcA family protein